MRAKDWGVLRHRTQLLLFVPGVNTVQQAKFASRPLRQDTLTTKTLISTPSINMWLSIIDQSLWSGAILPARLSFRTTPQPEPYPISSQNYCATSSTMESAYNIILPSTRWLNSPNKIQTVNILKYFLQNNSTNCSMAILFRPPSLASTSVY